MSDIEKIQLFESKKVRTLWVEEEDKWYFVLEDVIGILTESTDPKQYIKRMKLRDPELAKGWVQIVPLLSIQTEGGPQKMRCANLEGMFRIIQSIPSKKAEPFKRWMAQVAAERINQMIDPERSIDQAVADYRRLGYSEAWINQRIKTIEIRKGLTDEWKRGGVTKEVDFAFLTDLRKPQLKSANNAIRKGYLKMPVSPYPITRRTYLSRIPKNNNETGRSKAVCFVIF